MPQVLGQPTGERLDDQGNPIEPDEIAPAPNWDGRTAGPLPPLDAAPPEPGGSLPSMMDEVGELPLRGGPPPAAPVDTSTETGDYWTAFGNSAKDTAMRTAGGIATGLIAPLAHPLDAIKGAYDTADAVLPHVFRGAVENTPERQAKGRALVDGARQAFSGDPEAGGQAIGGLAGGLIAGRMLPKLSAARGPMIRGTARAVNTSAQYSKKINPWVRFSFGNVIGGPAAGAAAALAPDILKSTGASLESWGARYPMRRTGGPAAPLPPGWEGPTGTGTGGGTPPPDGILPTPGQGGSSRTSWPTPGDTPGNPPPGWNGRTGTGTATPAPDAVTPTPSQGPTGTSWPTPNRTGASSPLREAQAATPPPAAEVTPAQRAANATAWDGSPERMAARRENARWLREDLPAAIRARRTGAEPPVVDEPVTLAPEVTTSTPDGPDASFSGADFEPPVAAAPVAPPPVPTPAPAAPTSPPTGAPPVAASPSVPGAGPELFPNKSTGRWYARSKPGDPRLDSAGSMEELAGRIQAAPEEAAWRQYAESASPHGRPMPPRMPEAETPPGQSSELLKQILLEREGAGVDAAGVQREGPGQNIGQRRPILPSLKDQLEASLKERSGKTAATTTEEPVTPPVTESNRSLSARQEELARREAATNGMPTQGNGSDKPLFSPEQVAKGAADIAEAEAVREAARARVAAKAAGKAPGTVYTPPEGSGLEPHTRGEPVSPEKAKAYADHFGSEKAARHLGVTQSKVQELREAAPGYKAPTGTEPKAAPKAMTDAIDAKLKTLMGHDLMTYIHGSKGQARAYLKRLGYSLPPEGSAQAVAKIQELQAGEKLWEP